LQGRREKGKKRKCKGEVPRRNPEEGSGK